mgnify:FL=1
MRTTINGWLGMAAATILLTSCGSSPEPKPMAAPSTDRPEVLSAWIKVYETAIEESEVKRTAAGFVEHRRLEGKSEGSYFVYGIKDLKTPLGFFLPSGETYRYITEVNSKKVVSKSLGPLEPEAAVKILLRIKANVEFDKKLRL